MGGRRRGAGNDEIKKGDRYIPILIIHISEALNFITPNDIYTLFKKGIPKKETLPGRRQEP